VSLFFFTVRDSDGRLKDDPQGTDLPGAADALFRAEQTISKLRYEPGYENPQLMMIVRDRTGHSVWSLPFLPACA
jgi:hypothetical protein